jgi:predicted amidophosphoribosyltransferase
VKNKPPAIAELRRQWLRDNARQPNPLPVCPGCMTPFESADADWLDGRLCSTCGANRVEMLIRDLVNATSRPETLRALEAIVSLAM